MAFQFTSEEARLVGRIGAYRLHATHDPRQTTQKARSAFLARFELEVDPEGVLSLAERARRANAALKAHMARLAYLSAKSRRKRVVRRNGAHAQQLEVARSGVMGQPGRN